MTEITKEELRAYTEATERTATALEKVADRLQDIVVAQTDCKCRVDGVDVTTKVTRSTVEAMNVRGKAMSGNIIWVKWLWTVLAMVVGMGLIVIELLHKVVVP